MSRLSILFVLLAGALCALAPLGCGDDDGGSTDSDADSDSDSDSDTDTDSDTDSDADWGTCRKACDTAANCVPADADVTKDENNWECVADGYCNLLGCQDATECETLFPEMDNITCNTNVTPQECTLPCTDTGTPADCAVPESPLYGEDNFTCESSLCVHQGCNNDEECQEAFPETDLVCAQYTDPPVCFPSCAEPIDCTDAAVTADLFNEAHWLCTDGACEHRGCQSTQECTDSALGAGYICVF